MSTWRKPMYCTHREKMQFPDRKAVKPRVSLLFVKPDYIEVNIALHERRAAAESSNMSVLSCD